MVCISDWYTSIGEFSFPTFFLRLNAMEIQALIAADMETSTARGVMRRLHRAIKALPGAGFVGADCCVPTDSRHYRHALKITSGRAAWRLLVSSEQVRRAFEQRHTERLLVRPFRRIDRAREFRMFFYDRTLVAMSQYCLVRHFARLAKRDKEIWHCGKELAPRIAPYLPEKNQVVDVYLCSDGQLLLVDLNSWGGTTDPKLLKIWERDWGEEVGLKLIPRPIKMKGDVSISF